MIHRGVLTPKLENCYVMHIHVCMHKSNMSLYIPEFVWKACEMVGYKMIWHSVISQPLSVLRADQVAVLDSSSPHNEYARTQSPPVVQS